jgi:hypothetical protein
MLMLLLSAYCVRLQPCMHSPLLLLLLLVGQQLART